jgi:hypothetical protein
VVPNEVILHQVNHSEISVNVVQIAQTGRFPIMTSPKDRIINPNQRMNTETWMETFKEDINYDDIEYDDSSLEGVEIDYTTQY